MQHTDDADVDLAGQVVNNVAVDPQRAISTSHIAAIGANANVVGKTGDGLLDLTQIIVCLIRAPVFKRVLPDADQIAPGLRALVDPPRFKPAVCYAAAPRA